MPQAPGKVEAVIGVLWGEAQAAHLRGSLTESGSAVKVLAGEVLAGEGTQDGKDDKSDESDSGGNKVG